MNFYLSRGGVRVPRIVFVLLAGFVSAVLIVTTVPSDSFAATTAPT